EELKAIIDAVNLSEEEDIWRWKPEENEEFSVKSAYVLVCNLLIARENIALGKASAFKAMWKCPAPS
ncbi:hypothetical protein A2U01_0118277, partial [Trifolium medium]|nr:hypothetical protein [Trifolium medium]